MDSNAYQKSVTGLGMWQAFRNKKIPDADLADKLLSLGVTWFAPRVGDYGKLTDFTPKDFTALCKTFVDKGLVILPWYYSRPTFYDREVGVAKSLIDMGASGVIIDAEIEWEDAFASKRWVGQYRGVAYYARQYGAKLRAALGDAYIGHAPLAWLAYHGTFPYAEFGTFCDQVHPQSYWTELKVGAWSEDFRRNCLTIWETMQASGDVRAKNFAPIGVTYGRDEMIKLGMRPSSAPPGNLHADHLREFLIRYEEFDSALGGQKRPHSLYSWEARSPMVEAELESRLTRMREGVCK